MKWISIFLFLLFVSANVFSQTENDGVGNDNNTKEVAANSHGKMVSELAKNTPGGPEKGKIISSAARQKSIARANPNAPGRQNTNSNSGKPANVGKPATTGKPSTVPVGTPMRGKPAGIAGRK